MIVVALGMLFLAGCGAPPAAPLSEAPAATSSSAPSSTKPVSTLTPTSTSIPPEPVWSVMILDSNPFFKIETMILSQDDILWTTGKGGVVHWDLETGIHETFGHLDGMPGYSGADILTDAQGGIWIRWTHPTYKGYGVSRYYEGQWTHYDTSDGLADDIVNDIKTAPDGKVWFSTPSGISSFDGETWTTHTTVDGLPSNAVGLIATGSGGVVWVLTDEGIASFIDNEWVAYDHYGLKEAQVNDMTVTQDGWVWFATGDDYLISYNGQEFNQWGTPWDLPQGVNMLSFYDSLTVTQDSTLWSRGFRSIFAWRNNQLYSFSEENGLPFYSANGFLATQDGALWVTTTREGLIRISNWRFWDSDKYTAISIKYCISGIGVTIPLSGQFSISDLGDTRCIDENIYIGDGLQMTDGRLIFQAKESFLASKDIITIIEPDGQYQEHSLKQTEPELLLEPSPYQRTYGEDDSIWFTSSRLYQYDGQDWLDLIVWVSVVETGPDGRVWVGSKYALSVWDGKTWIHWTQEKADGSGDESIEVNAISFYGEDVWIGDSLRGISRLIGGQLDEPEWVTLELPEWDDKYDRPGISYLQFDSQGGLWAAGIHGLPAYYDGSNWYIPNQYNHEDVTLSALAVAPDDSLWISFKEDQGKDPITHKSIYEFQFMRFDGDQWYPFGQGDALPQVKINRILFAPDESVWVVYHNHGVVRFDPASRTWEAFNTSNVFTDANSDMIYDMFLDETDALWFQLSNGFARYGVPLDEGEK